MNNELLITSQKSPPSDYHLPDIGQEICHHSQAESYSAARKQAGASARNRASAARRCASVLRPNRIRKSNE